ncbi:helix-turn-helix domain-containing protein [Vibrio scophthalmi]|uniref:helix-turn-helix domain-containing protein n=1 Tax=Vibrio scophthalmi TaxID=45658 RepID=UPI0022849B3D|nr:helix-turn-helix domain-containing protein [Vibrio scophthalmi]
MSINSNEVKLIGRLLQKACAITVLAEEMAVSRRHIHNYIANINYYIEQAISVQKGIATLEISPEQWAQKIKDIPLTHYRPMSSERQDYLLDNYLFSNQYKYQKIEKQLGISRPTLKKDLSELSARLQLSGVSLHSTEGGFVVAGSEKKLRHLMLERINKQIEQIHPHIEFCTATTPLQHHTQTLITQLLATLPLKETYVIITNISHAIGGKFAAHFIKMMFIYLSVSLYRINQQFLILQKNNADYLRKTAKFKLVYNQLSLLINEKLEFEHLHLAEYFFSGCAEDNFHENQLRVKMCSMLFLRQLTQTIPLSKSQMTQLHGQLCQYLPSAIYRIKNHIHLQPADSIRLEHGYLAPIESTGAISHYQATILAMSTCQHWLLEPLRDEELQQISQFVAQVTQQDEQNKLSLEALLNTLQSHAKEIAYEPLKQALLNQYPTLFSDDTQPDYLRKNWFSVADIHWINSGADLVDIAELAALHLANKLGLHYQETIQPLSQVLTAFIDYLHMGSNVYLYSAQGQSSRQESSLQLVVQPGDISSQTPPSYYFFLLRSESTTSHQILYALHQFEQQKLRQEQEHSDNTDSSWIVELLKQNLA